ncbi:2-deoxy-D-gluconate 3-dehydrogenase [Microbotryum lychnidis-dioicae p1A1 Lamole]|uniref:2-deoxy-D-gluconate 3-dehydrogenase n=1 Tax=Microbotryum lychnidis-dioicae (strain p1A1 Lamole / MvSl-1064) TaxID=683840 RepID=U5H4F1_USTV1|nr:2-deoxy-D-gluconate 3-dehydrogenase [Microbotryum lychnidis-dioicae p1A1 Lamole]|eukprot:KDE07520.1 2-deoxy-D-gluconate 3-dehydrogenase [Microbotryum lychnidis-dioicae p1A1 Lamole]
MSYIDSLFGLSGKTALCTGATRGIGQTMALALAQAGADIVLVQRNKENLETYNKIKALGRQVDIAVCDLSSDIEVKGLVKQVVGPTSEGGLGREIDVLVNCGGIQRSADPPTRTPAENFSDGDWNDVLQVNLNAVWTLARDVGRHMLESRGGVSGEEAPKTENPRGRGKIINIASLLSFQGGLTVPAYAAAKHGVLGLGKALANEWSAKGINVNSIAPGYIATDMNEALIANPTRSRQIMERIPAQRWGAPTDFEGAVVFLASRASDYVCGECITVDGGWMGR